MDLYIVLGVRQMRRSPTSSGPTAAPARRSPGHQSGRSHGGGTLPPKLEAHETLIDEERRSRYDAGHGPVPAEDPRRNGFEGFDFSARGGGPLRKLWRPVRRSADGPRCADLDGRARRGPASRRRAHLRAGVHGARAHVRRDAARDVPGVRGAGISTAATARARCAGAPEPCVRCAVTWCFRARAAGAGQRPASSAGLCDVRRRRPRGALGDGCARVPPGVADGERLRVSGRGDAGLRGGPAGDCHVTVRVAPHERFRRDGDDIHVVVPVAIHEAGLGARIEVPSPDGGPVRVPPGTQSGQRFRLSDRGRAFDARGPARGSGRRGAGWCCRPCSTNGRRSCCGSSGGSTRAACAIACCRRWRRPTGQGE